MHPNVRQSSVCQRLLCILSACQNVQDYLWGLYESSEDAVVGVFEHNVCVHRLYKYQT